jgi:hypothetical protein
MLDPITVIATASAAYNALKKGIEIGRELQDMSGQLAAWAGAVSDLSISPRRPRTPRGGRWGRTSKLRPSRSLLRRRRSKAQRDELKTFIQYSYGQSGWEELLRIEAAVRKRKQATDHRKAEIKEMLITITIVTLVLAAGIAGLALLAYLLWASQQ